MYPLKPKTMPWAKNKVMFEIWVAWEHKNTSQLVLPKIPVLCWASRSIVCLFLNYLEMSGRQFFNESEKICLQELIVKYKLNSVATTMGSPALKKVAWARLMEEYNAIETNSKRTENQLKKCWDNLKTRRKSILAQEKRERMRTGGGSFNPNLPSTSNQVLVLEDALLEQTDVELIDVIDSDYTPFIEEMPNDSETLQDKPQTPPLRRPTNPLYSANESTSQILNESVTDRVPNTTTPPHASEPCPTDYDVASSQGPRNIRARVIQEEFSIRQKSYDKSQKREEELHKLKIAEREWMVKAAEQNFFKAKTDREASEELLHCNRAKREEAELHLATIKNKN